MMESDVDRLESIKALGGVPVRTDSEEFLAVFDRAFVAADVGLEIEGRAPALTCRSSDVQRLSKDQVTLRVEGADYRIKRSEPDIPAPGWTTLLLRV